MKSKDLITILIIGIGTFILTRKVKAQSPLVENPDIVETLRNADLGIDINNTELNVMQYADIMLYEGARQGIAPEIIAGIIRQESGGQPVTQTWEPKVNQYSYGLMQMLPSTANDLKASYPSLKYVYPESLFLPDVAIEIGTCYLAVNLNKYRTNPKINPITDMVASYNAGAAYVSGNIYTNQSYVSNVMSYKTRFRLMFSYLYPTYSSQFPVSSWGS